MTAEKIAARIEPTPPLFNIADTDVSEMQNYDFIIVGIPTWDYGELQEDWEECWEQLSDLDLTGKTVAIWGQGDQEGYGQWFQDAVGYLHDQLKSRGAKMVGYWPIEGYEFEASEALDDSETQFLGLALDDENQFDLSEERIDTWLKQIFSEL